MYRTEQLFFNYIGITFCLLFFLARLALAIAMRRNYDTLSQILAWFLCSPLMGIGLFCMYIASSLTMLD